MARDIRVLMVDDEAQFLATASKVLSRRGYVTTVAESGEAAIETLKTSPQDVVIMDIKMPGMDGDKALAELKKINPDVKVIMLTGHGGEDLAKESLKQGAFYYLNKPCEIELLASKIDDAYEAIQKDVKEEKNAGDIMIPIEAYTTIDPDSTIKEGIEKLKHSFEYGLSTSRIMETGHRSILVLDKPQELVGTLSILDLIRALRPTYLSIPEPSMVHSMRYSFMFRAGLFTTQAKGLVNKKIRDVMSSPPLSVDEGTNLMDIANLIVTERSRRLVVTRAEKAVGVVREQELFFEMAKIILQA